MLLIMDANSAIDINNKMATFQNNSLEEIVTNGIDISPVDNQELPKIQETLKVNISKPEITPDSDVSTLQIPKNGNIVKLVEEQEQQTLSKGNPEAAKNLTEASESKIIPTQESEETKNDSDECKNSELKQYNGSLNGNCNKLAPIASNKECINVSEIVDQTSNEDTIPDSKNSFQDELTIQTDDKLESSNQATADVQSSVQEKDTTCELFDSKNNSCESLHRDEGSTKIEDHIEANAKNNIESIDSKISKIETCSFDCDGDKGELVNTNATDNMSLGDLLENVQNASENVKNISNLTNATQKEVKDSTADDLDNNSVKSTDNLKNDTDLVEGDIEMDDSCENITNSEKTEKNVVAEVISVKNISKLTNATQKEVKDSSTDNLDNNSVKSADNLKNDTDLVKGDIEMDDSCDNITKSEKTEENVVAEVISVKNISNLTNATQKEVKDSSTDDLDNNSEKSADNLKNDTDLVEGEIEMDDSCDNITKSEKTEENVVAEVISVKNISNLTNATQKEVKDSTADDLDNNSVKSTDNLKNDTDLVEGDIEMDDSCENITKSEKTEENVVAEVISDCESDKKSEKGSKEEVLKGSMETEQIVVANCFQEKAPDKESIEVSLDDIGKSASKSNIALSDEDITTSIISKANTNQDDPMKSDVEENKIAMQAKDSEENSTSEVSSTNEEPPIKICESDIPCTNNESSVETLQKVNMETGEIIDDKSSPEKSSSEASIELAEKVNTPENSDETNDDIEENDVPSNKAVETNVERTVSRQSAIIPTKKEEIMDVDEEAEITKIKEVSDLQVQSETVKAKENTTSEAQPKIAKKTKLFTKLSNTLDILSDDDEPPIKEKKVTEQPSPQKQCINLDDDDDIMLISEANNEQLTDVSAKTKKNESVLLKKPPESIKALPANESATEGKKDSILNALLQAPPAKPNESKKEAIVEKKKPLIPENFLKTCKMNLVDMTRDDLEELCVLKIVESIVDRSVLSEIKTKLKSMAQTIDEYKTKTAALSKQNRDLQIVLKSVQEEQKKGSSSPIVPLKITRSVGLQVVMIEKSNRKKPAAPQSASSSQTNTATTPISKPNRSPVNQGPRPQTKPNNQQIPVPRLVPANTAAIKTNVLPGVNKGSIPVQVIASPQKVVEKRPRSSNQSMTVDLTDDEPPAKVPTRASPAPNVRLVPAQNLLTAQRQAAQAQAQANTPRKVFIPIGGQQNSLRPGQTIMMKTVPQQTPQRHRAPKAQAMVRMPSSPVNRIPRHPAPLPDAVKQYQPPNWKTLPPAPDLKLSKVENGIVISWKIEGYHEDSYEEIASYQLFAYQETTAHPSTALWKKIGDVKALPLPMACTLTQFMAGYKYYFAVRAVDIRSRFGPFSLPGSILLLNKA